MIDIFLFAAIAIFFFMRYKSVLGQRPDDSVINQQKDNIITLARDVTPKGDAKSDPAMQGKLSLSNSLDLLRQTDPSFDEKTFLQNAKAAFTFIIGAYASGDTDTLKPLLAPAVFKTYAGAITARNSQGETLEFVIERIKDAAISKVNLKNSLATVTVEFLSEQQQIVRAADGTVISGDPDLLEDVRDIWTFQRDVQKSDPTWLLIATQQAVV